MGAPKFIFIMGNMSYNMNMRFVTNIFSQEQYTCNVFQVSKYRIPFKHATDNRIKYVLTYIHIFEYLFMSRCLLIIVIKV